jgi:hypothetical protein
MMVNAGRLQVFDLDAPEVGEWLKNRNPVIPTSLTMARAAVQRGLACG